MTTVKNTPIILVSSLVTLPGPFIAAGGYGKIVDFSNKLQDMINEFYGNEFPSLSVPTVEVSWTGRRYIRVEVIDSYQSRRIHCFIDTRNGDILKAASYKTPAKHSRGNIFNADGGIGGVTVYGAKYL